MNQNADMIPDEVHNWILNLCGICLNEIVAWLKFY